MAEFSTTKITPNDNVQIPSVNGQTTGYQKNDELKAYVLGTLPADVQANTAAITSLNTTVENIVSVHEQTLANGKAREYKFSSGLLIINILIDGLALTSTQASQGLYLFTVSSSHINYTYNTPFVDAPTVSASGHSNGNTWLSFANETGSKTKMSYAEFFAIVSGAVLSGFSMTLTGRWK